jgi:type II secretory pathway pseudopilin PulG
MSEISANKIEENSAAQTMGGGWIPPTDVVDREAGFTLIEAVIALLIMLIVALGSASLFSFSIYNNSGGTDRATSLAIAQQALEALRSARFNSTTTDASLNAGTTVQSGIIRAGRRFNLTVVIDDNPATQAIDVNDGTNLKQITVTVVPQNIGSRWALGAAGGPVTLVTQRSRCYP